MGEDVEGSPIEQEHSRSYLHYTHLWRMATTSQRMEHLHVLPQLNLMKQRNTHFSTTHYDDTLEPDVEEAVRLTKNKTSNVNFISSTGSKGEGETEDEVIDQYEPVNESKFIRTN